MMVTLAFNDLNKGLYLDPVLEITQSFLKALFKAMSIKWPSFMTK